MTRTVRHFSLHRIAGARPGLGEGTELRVVADVEAGVLPVIQAEEAVIRGYISTEFRNSKPVLSPAEVSGVRIPYWPHRWVTLFVLEDLQPLVRQLRLGVAPASLTTLGPALGHPRRGEPARGQALWLRNRQPLSPESAAALEYRPVVNVYDLADLTGCNIFANRRAMVEQGYWDDPLALRGLLAHEHAHPLAENETARASRQLQLEIQWKEEEPGRRGDAETRTVTLPHLHRVPMLQVLASLAEKLCLYAPREIFANEVTIQSGFADGLLHLNLRNVDNAGRSVSGRDALVQQLRQEAAQGNLTPAAADLVLLVGDLSGYLDLALEVAPFYRAGRVADAGSLETALQTTVFPHLDRLVPQAFADLRDRYIDLRTDLTGPELLLWGQGVLDTLTGASAEKGLKIAYRLSLMADG